MSYSAAEHDVPTTGWMLVRSLWMLVTLIPGAVLSWAGFLYIGIVGRMPRWITVGAMLGALTILAHTPILGQWRPVGITVVYIGAMLLALVANPSWLRATWVRSTPTLASEPARQRTSPRTSSPTPTRAQRRRGQAPASRQTKAPERITAEAEAVGASSASFFAAEPAAADPIDVNTASVTALSGLPGLSRGKARELNKRRDAMGGWPSLDAFESAAGLAPHELMRLRQAATCSPRKRGARAFGRRVDL